VDSFVPSLKQTPAVEIEYPQNKQKEGKPNANPVGRRTQAIKKQKNQV
jgi:hypothetical protein